MKFFFIECANREAQEQIKELSDMNFAIGSHTMTHAFLNEVEKEQAFWEINASKKIIEELTSKKCEWLCLPRGRGNEEIYKMIMDAGYKYIRSTKIFNLESIKLGLNHTTIHACPIRPEYEGKNWIDFFDDYLKKSVKEKGTFKFWVHYWELEKYGIFLEFEDCLKKLKEVKDEQIADRKNKGTSVTS